MNVRKIAGASLVATPFVLIAFAEAANEGWVAVAQTFGVVVLLALLIFGGLALWYWGD